MERPDFSRATILVIGDVMLDKYHFGTVHRISPEAPVPVVKVERSYSTLGGAGNVVNSIAHLHGNAVLIGFVGRDENKLILSGLLDKINAKSVLIETESPTITKIRLIGEHQQIVRLDFEEIAEIDGRHSAEIMASVMDWIDKVDAVVISDYGKGVCHDEMCQKVIELARERDLLVVVDSKGYDWSKYRNATIIKPNVRELSKVIGREIENEDGDIERCGKEVLKDYGLSHVLVTRSEKGMSLVSDEGITHFPTEAREVFDVSGAGDAVVATLSLALASGIDLKASIDLANKAAGIVVSKMGTAPIEYDELMLAQYGYGNNGKIVNIDYIPVLVGKLRQKNKRIVFTNGCFDVLQKDHIVWLREAKTLGDVLIVGLSSDDSGTRLKSSARPLNNQNDRAEIISALGFVDYVVIFDEDTRYRLTECVMPDMLVVAGDCETEEIVGREFAKDVVVIPFVERDSTTGITNQIAKHVA